MKKEAPTGSAVPVPAQAGPAATPIQFDPDEQSGVLNRLKRAQGQLGGVIRMLEEGRDCGDIVTQLAAVSKALDRVGFAVIAASLKQCLTQEPDSEHLDTAAVERLFLSLA